MKKKIHKLTTTKTTVD